MTAVLSSNFREKESIKETLHAIMDKAHRKTV